MSHETVPLRISLFILFHAGKVLSVTRFKAFTLFPVLLTILLMWGMCGIYTLAGGSNPAIRTDTNLDILSKSNWFRMPYPRKRLPYL